jgi:acetyl esterase/lipase
MKRRLASLVLIIPLMGAFTARPAGADSLNEDLDVTWRHAGGWTLKADFYWPSRRCPCPGVVEVHGGGFFTGTRKWNTDEAKALAQAGYYVMNTDYRLTGSYGPALEDVIAAVHYLQGRTGVIDSRIGMHGTSAGAVLTTMASIQGRASQLDVGVAWSGGMDEPYVNAGSAPLLLITSTQDPRKPASAITYNAYRAADRPADLTVRRGAAHGLDFEGDPVAEAQTIQWLDRYLNP